MFGGKREKRLEEEVAQLKAEREIRHMELTGIREQRDRTIEHLEHIDRSREQMQKDIEQVEEHIHHIEELTGSSEQAAGDVHSAMIEMNNAVGTFDVNHSVFVKKRKEQDEMIMEIVENNKHFTTPMKCITELPSELRDDYGMMHEQLRKMKEASHHMSVVSLDAAIEAGRMGENAEHFVDTMEDVRLTGMRYERAASEIEERIGVAESRINDLEEQIKRLNELLKENNISMSKLMQNGKQGMASYEAGQLDLRDILSDASIGKTDALQLSEREINKIVERMSLQMGDIKDEFTSQGEHISWLDELLGKDELKKAKKDKEKESDREE